MIDYNSGIDPNPLPPVAIVGIGGIFPGGDDLKDFKKIITEGISTSREIPPHRLIFSMEDAYQQGGIFPDKVYSKKGCLLNDFDISNLIEFKELDIEESFVKELDPLFQITLLAGVRAYRNSNMEKVDHRRVGIVLGNIALPTETASALTEEILGKTLKEQLSDRNNKRSQNKKVNPLNRYVTGLPAGILSKSLRLGGGSLTLDAACASSLYAIKLAVDELISYRADAVLSGGVCRPHCLYTQMGFSQLNALSPTGVCSPFDKKMNGLVIGEGAGIMVLKRLEDALRDHDHIYGVIRGIGLSNDISGNLLAPDSGGQMRALQNAYIQAGWKPWDLDAIECHATGTPTGDVIEFQSLSKLWKDHPVLERKCVLGSVKSNVGHLLTGAGAVGTIKMLLALQEGILLPTANFESPGTGIELENSPFTVLKTAQQWKRKSDSTPRRFAVNGFGFGGINAHVLIEEWIADKNKKENIYNIPIEKISPQPVAVVGISAHFGPWDSTDKFRERVFNLDSDTKTGAKTNSFGVQSSKWFKEKYNNIDFKGFGIDNIDIPMGKFRIPPKEMEEMLPQQLLMLKVAHDALSSVKVDHPLTSGAIIGINFDMNTTNFHFRWDILNKVKEWIKEENHKLSNKEIEDIIKNLRDDVHPALNANRTMGALGSIVASRIAREFRLGGPSFTLSSEETSGLRSLEIGVRQLQRNEMDLVLVGSVDMAGDIRSLIIKKEVGLKGYSINEENNIPFGEGAGALVLKRLKDAQKDGDQIFAVIKGIGVSSGNSSYSACSSTYSTNPFSLSVYRGCREAGISPQDIGCLEFIPYGGRDYLNEGDLLSIFRKTSHFDDSLSSDEKIASSPPPINDMLDSAYNNKISPTEKAISPEGHPLILSSVGHSIGDAGAGSGSAGLISAVLSLYHQSLPPWKGIQDNENNLKKEEINKKELYFPQTPQYWLRNRIDGKRMACVSSFGIDNTWVSVILEEYDGIDEKQDIEQNNVREDKLRSSTLEENIKSGSISFNSDCIYEGHKNYRQETDLADPNNYINKDNINSESVLACSSSTISKSSPAHIPTPPLPPEELLFVIEGDNINQLLTKSNQLEDFIKNSNYSNKRLYSIAKEWYFQNPLNPDYKKALSIIASNRGEIFDSISKIRKILFEREQGIHSNNLITTNINGISFNPNGDNIFYSPLSPVSGGKIAFVFPGSGNHYAGMGRESALYNPQVLHRQDHENLYLRNQIQPQIFWNSSSLADMDNAHKSLIMGQVTAGTIFSDILREFQINPDAVIGYSLGETAGLISMRVWRERDLMLERVHKTTLFTEDLAGKCTAIAKSWNLSPDEKVDWILGVVDTPADRVKEIISGREKVYLLIINTPNECVIGGDRQQVYNLIHDLKCNFIPIPGVTAVHNPAMKPVAGKYRDFHLFNVHTVKGIDFYSCGWAKKYDITTENCADSIQYQALNTVNFPQLINSAYDNGIRIFIETGPGSSCSRMISGILRDKPHIARSCSMSGMREFSSLLRLLAFLVSHRIPLSLDPLYRYKYIGCEENVIESKKLKYISIPVGRKPFNVKSELLMPVKMMSVADETDSSTGIIPDRVKIASSQAPGNDRIPSLYDNDKPDSRHRFESPSQGRSAKTEDSHTRYQSRQASVDSTPLFAISIPSSGYHSISSPFQPLVEKLEEGFIQQAKAHSSYLTFSQNISDIIAKNIHTQMSLMEMMKGEEIPAELFQANLVPVKEEQGSYESQDEHEELLHSVQNGRESDDRELRGREAEHREEVEILGSAQNNRESVGGEADDEERRKREEDIISSLSLSSQSLSSANVCPSLKDQSLSESPVRPHSLWEEETLLKSSSTAISTPDILSITPRSLNREQCMEFAVGSVGKVLGELYKDIDKHPTRVRLPDEPLMLVDRILSIEGEPLSLTNGRVVTEHDVKKGAWYLDGGRIPTCIAVEAGQADLFLSGYLGIDLRTKGLAVYRLLDATITFHRSLPQPGETIRYNIQIEKFFQQGETYLFKFNFESTVNGQPLLTMKNGCAGFFTFKELNEGKGIIHTALDQRPLKGKKPEDWQYPVSMEVESYADNQITALRRGDLAGCFGPKFEGLPLKKPLTIPGGKMKLVDRVLHIDPNGGRFGLGIIRADADIHPDDWFLTCHFSDDNVMPGTLMYECCMHTFRIFLLRMGWMGEEGHVTWEPIPAVTSSLKCRGQVTATTKRAGYEISIKEIGYNPQPYAIADALMYADGKPVVEMLNMSIRLSGSDKDKIHQIWINRQKGLEKEMPDENIMEKPVVPSDRILAFAVGSPSYAFGEPYKIFDEDRIIARLPGPPYQFMDSVIDIQAEPWQMTPGGIITAQYRVPEDEWYFDSNRQDNMPFAVLLEIALQPCGWFSAYMGSALHGGETDLSYRNLGGSAIQLEPVTRKSGVLTTRVKSTKVSTSGGMIIQNFDFDMFRGKKCVYKGDTYFGFFSKEALAQQIGIRDPQMYHPTREEISRGFSLPYPIAFPFPDEKLRMIDNISLFIPDGGPMGLGYIRGTMKVDPSAWFFKAHFYQDPVIPGSLGLESMLQLMKFVAHHRWGNSRKGTLLAMPLGINHKWIYRGQVIPKNEYVEVSAWITAIDDKNGVMFANGFLSRDHLTIYEMRDFALRLKVE